MNRFAFITIIVGSAAAIGEEKATRSFQHVGNMANFMQVPFHGVEKHSLLGLKDVPKTTEAPKEQSPLTKDAAPPAAAPAAPAPATEGPKPFFTAETMPAVSPTLQCVINLSIQYFVIYTLLAFMRTFNQFTNNSLLGMQKICETASNTVTYAPMLAVLFVGVRMQAIQLTQGETEKYKLPQPWVQHAMYVATFAVLAQVVLVVLMPIFTGEWEVKCDKEGNIDQSAMKSAGICGIIVSTFRYIVLVALYGAMITVLVGAFMMESPKEIWGEEEAPPVSPAVGCTMNLTCQFFVIYLLVAIIKTVTEFAGVEVPILTKLSGLLTLAKYTVNFAPMLCILFIGAFMRAQQMDSKGGSPQWWAEYCFYLCTYSVMVQAIMIVVVPLFVTCECKQGACEGDVVFEMESQCVNALLTVIRYLALLALYGGFTAVIVSVFLIEHPTDVSLTPAISPAMKCVMNLTVQYFFIYLMLFILITLKQFTGISSLSIAISIFEAGQKTVMFAPMLSILFIGTRMRALQLAKAQDGTIPTEAGPPGYAQDAMFLCTWAVLIQVCMALLVCLLTCGGAPQMDEDGNVKKPEGGNFVVGIILDIIKYLSMLAMYGGVVTIIVAIFLMKPENLPPYAPRGSLIPGVPVAGPPTPPTPSL